VKEGNRLGKTEAECRGRRRRDAGVRTDEASAEDKGKRHLIPEKPKLKQGGKNWGGARA